MSPLRKILGLVALTGSALISGRYVFSAEHNEPWWPIFAIGLAVLSFAIIVPSGKQKN